MTALRILDALQQAQVTGDHAQAAASAGFMEWVFCLPLDADTAGEARRALDGIGAGSAHSAAAHLFLCYLQQATHPAKPATRRGGRKRLLH